MRVIYAGRPGGWTRTVFAADARWRYYTLDGDDVEHEIRSVREATGRLLMTMRSLTEAGLIARSLFSYEASKHKARV